MLITQLRWRFSTDHARFASHVMPSVLLVDCPEECLRGLLSIIRMNESLPPAINESFEASPTIFKRSLREMRWFSGRRAVQRPSQWVWTYLNAQRGCPEPLLTANLRHHLNIMLDINM
jgi:hypothetical protein